MFKQFCSVRANMAGLPTPQLSFTSGSLQSQLGGAQSLPSLKQSDVAETAPWPGAPPAQSRSHSPETIAELFPNSGRGNAPFPVTTSLMLNMSYFNQNHTISSESRKVTVILRDCLDSPQQQGICKNLLCTFWKAPYEPTTLRPRIKVKICFRFPGAKQIA